VVIVTGGNSGTGYASCKALYDKGAKVYLACRDKQRGEEAIENIKKGGDFFAVGFKFPKSPPKDTGKRGELVLMQLDLADISSIDSFVKDFER
jgi:NAD(P)-dependent dehydrogenase (short-subunit alcohol dehydrogenase family)